MRCFAIFLVGMFLLTACQPATPQSLNVATTGIEFPLAPAETITIIDPGPNNLEPNQPLTIYGEKLNIELIGVTSDERCPSEIECAMSGPVSISLSVQLGDANPVDIDLQTFTDYNGRAPNKEFEGIKSRVTYEGYLILVAGVLPYPAKSTAEIKDSDYRVTLVVQKE